MTYKPVFYDCLVVPSYPTNTLTSCRPHHCVDGWIKAERCVFGGERFPGGRDQVRVSCAGSAVCDVLQRRLAAQSGVVWSAGGQEMRRLVSCHHLTCVGKDGGREEAEGVNTWKTKCESLNGDAGCDQRGSERPERTQPLLLCIISTVHHFKRLAA